MSRRLALLVAGPIAALLCMEQPAVAGPDIGGAEDLAMGGVTVGNPRSSASVLTDPAVLTLKDRYELQASGDLGPDHLLGVRAYALDSSTGPFTLGLGYQYLHTVPMTSDAELPGWILPGEDLSNPQTTTVLGGGLGTSFGDRRLGVGVGFTWYQRATRFANPQHWPEGRVSVAGRVGDQEQLVVSAVADNLLQPANALTPMKFGVGTTWRPTEPFALAGQLDLRTGTFQGPAEVAFGVGAEGLIAQTVALRGGFRRDADRASDFITAGVGAYTDQLSLDYSVEVVVGHAGDPPPGWNDGRNPTATHAVSQDQPVGRACVGPAGVAVAGGQRSGFLTLLLWSLAGCHREVETPAAAYVEAAQTADPEACRSMVDVGLRGECLAFVAQAQAETGDLPLARQICASVAPGSWHDECWFQLSDSLRAEDDLARDLCSHAGQYQNYCIAHALSRQAQQVLDGTSVGEEPQALARIEQLATAYLGTARGPQSGEGDRAPSHCRAVLGQGPVPGSLWHCPTRFVSGRVRPGHRGRGGCRRRRHRGPYDTGASVLGGPLAHRPGLRARSIGRYRQAGGFAGLGAIRRAGGVGCLESALRFEAPRGSCTLAKPGAAPVRRCARRPWPPWPTAKVIGAGVGAHGPVAGAPARLLLLATLTVVGCGRSASNAGPAHAYIAASRQADPARCGIITDADLRGECMSFAAVAQAAGGDMSAARRTCREMAAGTWHDECWFHVADAIRASGDLARQLCAEAGRFRAPCFSHVMARDARDLLERFPKGQERQALEQVRTMASSYVGPRLGAVRARLFVRKALAARLADAPLSLEVCGTAPPILCRDAYVQRVELEELQDDHAAAEERAPARSGLSRVQQVCRGQRSLQAVEAAGFPSWKPDAQTMALQAWAQLCSRPIHPAATAVSEVGQGGSVPGGAVSDTGSPER